MAKHKSAIEIVKAFVAAFPITEEAVATSMLSDDFVVRQADSLPYGGPWIGPAAYIDLIREILATWSDLVVHSSVMLHEPGSEYVVVLMKVSGRGRHGEFTMPVADICRVRDGKICELTPMYHDTKWLHEIHFGRQPEREPVGLKGEASTSR
jgi:ketosteroid isomerase-like protein